LSIFFAGILLVAFLPKFAGALTEDEKKQLFLKAREEMKTVQGEEQQPSGARPRPKPAAKLPHPAPPEPHPPEKAAETPVPAPAATPAPHFEKLATPPPARQPAPAPLPGAAVTIEKSGLEQAEGLEPAPASERPGFFGFFRGGPQYRYLTRSVRAEIDRAPVPRHLWRYIVVHNSGTRQGNAKIFDYYHRRVRKMPNGLAYHFVIGNGTSSGNGQIEVGERWRRQINGGHVHSDYLNHIALGVCLVGDFNRSQPTRQQLEALDELVRYLRQRVGKIDRKPAIVKAHRDINPPQWPTDCPGDRFPFRWLHNRFD
jgi:hypothetical protein